MHPADDPACGGGIPGQPPFEKPNIEQGVLNFVQYKFSHLAPRERQTMFELSKMFLLCLNYWKLETPAQFRQRSQAEDVATYKVNYTRWLCYCHVPQSCDSLPGMRPLTSLGAAFSAPSSRLPGDSC